MGEDRRNRYVHSLMRGCSSTDSCSGVDQRMAMTTPGKSALSGLVSILPLSGGMVLEGSSLPLGFYSVLSKSDRPVVRSNGNDIFSIMV